MKKSVLVILMLITCLNAEAKNHKQKKKKTSAGTEIKSVSVFHSVCYGRCPEYKVEIASDGIATYTGMRFTEDTGIFQKNIGKTKAKEIIDMFVTNRADTCRDMYENRIPDLPGVTMTINYPNKTKTIMKSNYGPVFLRQIAEKMEEVGKKTDDTWKKTGMPNLN